MRAFQGIFNVKQLAMGGVWEVITRWCLYLVVLLTPMVFLPWTLYPLSLNKQFVFIALILLAMISWLIKGIAKGELVYAVSPINWLVLLLVIFVFISAWFSGSRTLSFMGTNGGEVDTLLSVLGFALLYFLLASTLKNEKEIKTIFNLFLASATAVLVFGFLQILGWHVLPWAFAKDTAFNSVGTTNALGIFLGLIFVMAMTLLYDERAAISTATKGWLGILAAAAFTIVFLVGYWPVFIGLILATMALLVVNIKKNKFLLPFAILAVSIFVILVNVGFIRFRLPVLRLPAEVTPSLGASWDIAKNTIQSGVKNFILGSGPATYQYQYGLYRDTSLNNTAFWSLKFSQGYNVFLTYLVNWGFMGSLLLSAFILAVLFLVFKSISRDGARSAVVLGVDIGLIYLVALMFFYPQNFVLHFSFFVLAGLMAAAAAVAKEDYRSFSLVSSPQKTFIFSLVIMLLIMTATSLLYINGQRYLGAVYFASGANLANASGDVERAMADLLAGLNLDPKNDTYLQTLASAFLIKVNNTLSKPDISPKDLQAEFSQSIGAAIETARQSTVASPRNSSNWLGLARVYESVIMLIPGAAEQAFNAYEEAAKLEPNNPLIYSNLGRAHLAAADRWSQELTAASAGDTAKIKELKEKRNTEYDLAINNLEKALNLKPDYAPAHFSLVQVFDQQGKTEEAIARAERLKVVALADNNTNNDIGVLFQLGLLHYQAKRFNKAREMFEGAVQISPDYSNAAYFLGLIYDKQSDSAGALEQFERVARLNPDNEEVKKIIRNLKNGRAALSGIVQVEERKAAPIEEASREVIVPSAQ